MRAARAVRAAARDAEGCDAPRALGDHQPTSSRSKLRLGPCKKGRARDSRSRIRLQPDHEVSRGALGRALDVPKGDGVAFLRLDREIIRAGLSVLAADGVRVAVPGEDLAVRLDGPGPPNQTRGVRRGYVRVVRGRQGKRGRQTASGNERRCQQPTAPRSNEHR